MAWPGASGLGFLMRFQSGCQLRLWRQGGLTGTEGSASKMVHTRGGQTGAGCWREASVPLHMGLSTGCNNKELRPLWGDECAEARWSRRLITHKPACFAELVCWDVGLFI